MEYNSDRSWKFRGQHLNHHIAVPEGAQFECKLRSGQALKTGIGLRYRDECYYEDYELSQKDINRWNHTGEAWRFELNNFHGGRLFAENWSINLRILSADEQLILAGELLKC